MIVLAPSQIQLYPRTGLGQWGGVTANQPPAKVMGNQREAGKKNRADSDELKVRHPRFAPHPATQFRHIFAWPRFYGVASIDRLGANGGAPVEGISPA